MTKRVDLHSHTTASDGTYTPEMNFKRAKARGLAALGITDHDTVAGLADARNFARETGVELVPGIEISTLHQGQDVHVLGYYVDDQDVAFLERLKELRETRNRRNEMMIEKLNQLGIEITIGDVYARKKKENGNVGRPHIAEVLMDRGIVSSMEEAFEKYLGKEGKAYVNPPRISPEEAIDLIKSAGGAVVLAHPGLYGDDEMVQNLIDYGLDGIEVYHPDHHDDEEKKYLKMAEQSGLIVTAGSDFHGERNGDIFHADLGTKTVPYDTVQQLKQIAERRR
ncbi:MAG: PHP domain-containing protein [Bacillaceae bacterium]|nr:PHP domain-containing protein [Bacillaceae bacterium]